MKTIRINRKKWLKGYKNPDGSYNDCPTLVDHNNNKCCLGFHACQITRKNKDNFRFGEPENCGINIPFLTNKLNFGYENTKFALDCMTINDNSNISDKMREYKLKRKFKAQGLNLEFYN